MHIVLIPILTNQTYIMQMKRFSQWGARLFFSATVAFSVPSIYKDGGLLRLEPFWKGLVLTAAAVVGKLVVGLFAGPPLTFSGFLKLGWAMNGRCVRACVSMASQLTRQIGFL